MSSALNLSPPCPRRSRGTRASQRCSSRPGVRRPDQGLEILLTGKRPDPCMERTGGVQNEHQSGEHEAGKEATDGQGLLMQDAPFSGCHRLARRNPRRSLGERWSDRQTACPPHPTVAGRTTHLRIAQWGTHAVRVGSEPWFARKLAKIVPPTIRRWRNPPATSNTPCNLQEPRRGARPRSSRGITIDPERTDPGDRGTPQRSCCRRYCRSSYDRLR